MNKLNENEIGTRLDRANMEEPIAVIKITFDDLPPVAINLFYIFMVSVIIYIYVKILDIVLMLYRFRLYWRVPDV